MVREAIALNGDKVRFCIAAAGIPRKQLLNGSEKTVQRILRGQNTSLATAVQLARELKVTIEDLTIPVTESDLERSLPEHWLYDESPAPAGISNHRPFWSLIGGGYRYMVGYAPTVMIGPLQQLLKTRMTCSRKIVLRRDEHAFVMEIHYFDYSPDHGQRVVYEMSTTCRFFPLARNGDAFSKSALNERLHRFMWHWLHSAAVDNAELVAVEGREFPEHPYSYLPLVRFFQGPLHSRKALGARVFSQLHADFRASLIDYLIAIPDRRCIRASVTGSGFEITIEPERPQLPKPGWRDNVKVMAVDLVWKASAGGIRRAPWRREHREEFVAAINEGRWRDCHSRGMPHRYYPPDGADDPDTPPLAPDTEMTAEDVAAINNMANYDPYWTLWEP